MARHADRRAAEEGRGSRPPPPGRSSARRASSTSRSAAPSSTSASRSSAPPSTSGRPSACRRRRSGARWRAPPTPRSCPRSCAAASCRTLRIELANLERQQAQLLERYLDQHPEVVKVRNQIQETRSKIRGEAQRVIRAAENDYKAAAAQEASVSSALESAKQETLAARPPGGQLRLAEARGGRGPPGARQPHVPRQADRRRLRAQVHQHPHRGPRGRAPTAPSARRSCATSLLGILLGAFLSIGLAFFLEYLDNTLKTPDDVRHHLGAPLLGVVPELTSDEHPNLVVLNTELDQRLRRGLPRRPHRPQLLLDRAGLAHHHRHLHRTRRGQDPHRGQPRRSRSPRTEGQDPAHRRRPAQAHRRTRSCAAEDARASPTSSWARPSPPRPSSRRSRARPSPTSRAAPPSRARPTS